MMLSNSPVTPTLPVTDMARARGFYEGTLGLKATMESDKGVMLDCGGGTSLLLYERPPSPTDHTEASFMVEDIESEVDELRGKGVTFEEYDMPGIKTENGIATSNGMKSAWFKDTEGNILALTQM